MNVGAGSMSDEVRAARVLTAIQQQWLEHLKTWQAQEALSLREYATAHGLSVSGLYSAKRWFKVKGLWQGREVSGAGRKSAPKLVPVRVSPGSVAPRMSAPLRVLLPNGVVLEMPEHIEPERCQALVAALGAARP